MQQKIPLRKDPLPVQSASIPEILVRGEASRDQAALMWEGCLSFCRQESKTSERKIYVTTASAHCYSARPGLVVIPRLMGVVYWGFFLERLPNYLGSYVLGTLGRFNV